MADPPETRVTTKLDAVVPPRPGPVEDPPPTLRAVLQAVLDVKRNQEDQAGRLGNIEEDLNGLLSWRSRVSERIRRHSERAAQPSDVDLELQAVQGLTIAKNREQDEAIKEIRVIVGEMHAGDAARALVLKNIASGVDRALRSKWAERVAVSLALATMAVLGYLARKFG